MKTPDFSLLNGSNGASLASDLQRRRVGALTTCSPGGLCAIADKYRAISVPPSILSQAARFCNENAHIVLGLGLIYLQAEPVAHALRAFDCEKDLNNHSLPRFTIGHVPFHICSRISPLMAICLTRRQLVISHAPRKKGSWPSLIEQLEEVRIRP